MRPLHTSAGAAATPPATRSSTAPAAAHASVGSRHQRFLSGAHIIKSYVHESDLRREASKFNNAAALLYDSHRVEDKGDSEDRVQQGAVAVVAVIANDDPHLQSSHKSKQDLVRLPAKPSTAPAESASYRLRQHAPVASASNQSDEEHDVQRHPRAHVHSDNARVGVGSPAQQPLAAFFAGKSVHRARRLSISAAHAAQMQAMAANSSGAGAGGSTAAGVLPKPVAVAKRRLLIESGVPPGPHAYRAPQSVMLTSPRGRNNASRSLRALIAETCRVCSSLHRTSPCDVRICVCLCGCLVWNQLSSKLDSVIKSSQWMRRKVVLGEESGSKQGLGRGSKQQYSPRHGSIASGGASHGSDAASAPSASAVSTAATGTAAGASSSGESSRDIAHHDLEKKVMAAFSRIVRMWRERKRRSEAKTLTMMNGNKLRKDNGIQSAHVVGILSRRMIREVPALKFFDVEPEAPVNGPGGARVAADHSTASSSAAANRNTPRGVCYTLDANGCRCIKMESGALRASRMSQRDHRHRKSEEITIEKAMGKTLRRKMAKRVKAKRLEVRKLTDDFHKARLDRSMKLHAQLALHQAEGEKMFSKRLSLVMVDDTSLPLYQAAKERLLARVRYRKANLLERCQTLHALGALLQHIDVRGEASGADVSSSELHFLDLFRCVVEEDRVLTPLISDGIAQQLSPHELRHASVVELLAILQRHASHAVCP